jgi:hypothetical protein
VKVTEFRGQWVKGEALVAARHISRVERVWGSPKQGVQHKYSAPPNT